MRAVLIVTLVLLGAGWVSAQFEELLGGLLGGLAGAGGEGGNGQCEYKCPSGKAPKHRKGHVPTTNGCGSYGLKVSTEGVDFEPCCDVHDMCYDTCGASKAQCDSDFNKCMKQMCESMSDPELAKSCQGSASMYYLGTATFGCDAFIKAQKGACKCPKKKKQPAIEYNPEL